MDMKFAGKSALIDYGLELQRCLLSAPVRKRSLISVPFSDGSIDLLRDYGEPRYESRTLRAEFTAHRNVQQTVSSLLTAFEGKRIQIHLPGGTYYMNGDMHISAAGYFPGADVVITATVDPWRYPVSGSGGKVL